MNYFGASEGPVETSMNIPFNRAPRTGCGWAMLAVFTVVALIAAGPIGNNIHFNHH